MKKPSGNAREVDVQIGETIADLARRQMPHEPEFRVTLGLEETD